MSRYIATRAIRGANALVTEAELMLSKALKEKGPDTPVSFPNTAYYIPVIGGMTGEQVEKLGQLEGVLAHELAHIKHRDILTGTIVATIAGAISMLAQMAQWAMLFGGGRRDDDEGGSPIVALVMMIVAPIAAMLVQMAISRTREYEADKGGAQIAGNPYGLVNALQKLEQAAQAVPMQDAKPATAHMFIVNPLTGGGIMKLFSTHPPIAERVKRLRELARG